MTAAPRPGDKPAVRHKYAYLDGLRGVAAICVMLMHGQNWFDALPPFRFGYLCVDFFFALSGFVLAHAYEERLAAPGSFAPFLRDRVVRLHPMLVLGALLGAGSLAVRVHAHGGALGWRDGVAIPAAIVPLPAFWDDALWPVNPPTWSIFWELIINLIFALVARRLTGSVLGAIVALLAVALIGLSLSLGGIGPLGPNPPVAPAIVRVAASFFIGVALLRLHRRGVLVTSKQRRWIPLLLVATAVAPVPDRFVAIYDVAVALGIYPLLILAAAGSAPVWPRLCSVAGTLSYPLYAIHMPILLVAGGLASRLGLENSAAEPVAGTALFVAIAGVSWLASTWYDVPVRAALRRRFGSRAHRAAPQPLDAAPSRP